VQSLESEQLAARAGAYRAEGIRSLISVPLPIEGVCRGALVAYFRTPHTTTGEEVQAAIALGHLAAAAISNSETRVRQESLRAEAERQSQRMAFLAEAAAVLASLDVESGFRRLAELAVPRLGDWCAIDIERDGWLLRAAVAHPDPEKLRMAAELTRDYPIELDSPAGVARVLRTGESELYPEISDEMLASAARDAAHLQRLRALEFKSALMAPLNARGHTLGVLTLVSSSADRRYDETDRAFVEEVARRAAMAIDNARLYEEAQRANRAKDQFLALLSHELRTPLNAIMGWTQVLMTLGPTGSDGQRRRGLEIIQRNTKLQADLVDGLLDVARAATGGLPLARQPIDVAESVATVIEGMRPAASARGVQIDLTVEAARCRVLADPNRFHQIVANLLSNAVKFTDGEGRVRVAVRQIDRWSEIEVTDHGVGIPHDFLPYVFDRFRQADSSPTRQHGGLGLGLWLVQQLVRAHDGTIQAASAGPGRGASFTLRLPLVD
jgi:signal transduction histidine kinase